MSINQSIQDLKAKVSIFGPSKNDQNDPFQVIYGQRPQSAITRSKPQSYQKQVAEMKELGQAALGFSTTSLRSTFQGRSDPLAESNFMKTFQSEGPRRFISSNDFTTSINMEDLFIQDDNKITMRYRQPLLKAKHGKPFKSSKNIDTGKKPIQPHEVTKKMTTGGNSSKKLLISDLISVRGSNNFNN